MSDGAGKPGAGEPAPGPFYEFIAQLRRMADQLDRSPGFGKPLTSMPSLPSMPSMPPFPAMPAVSWTAPPMPGALSAAQLKAMSSAVAAQRSSIASMQDQLRAFDEQLAVLEQIIVPLAEWSRTWAELERRVVPPPPGKAGPAQSGD